MSAKYKALLAELEKEDTSSNNNSSSSTTQVISSPLYPSRAKQEDEDDDNTIKKGQLRKVRGTQQTVCDITSVTMNNKDFTPMKPAAASISSTVTNADAKKVAASSSTKEEKQEESTSLTLVANTTSLNKILPHIPGDILRDRISQLTPIINRLIDDWTAVTKHAAIMLNPPLNSSSSSSASSSTSPTATSSSSTSSFPEMPLLSEVIEFSDFVKNSLDVCGLSSLDPASLQTMQRIIAKNERVAKEATENYEQKEHTVLEWIFKSQASTIRALKADIEQIDGFIQLREIILNHCRSVLGCINASIARVFGVAKTERTCNRERMLLNEVGRTQLALSSQAMTGREQVELQERLATLPFRKNAIILNDLVDELSQFDRPEFLVKDLAAAHNRARKAEELADLILKQIRETEYLEEEKWNNWNEKYGRAREKMNSARVVKIRNLSSCSSSSSDDNDGSDANTTTNNNTNSQEKADEVKRQRKAQRRKRRKLLQMQQQQQQLEQQQEVASPLSPTSSATVLLDEQERLKIEKRIPVSVTTGEYLIDDKDWFVKKVKDEEQYLMSERRKRSVGTCKLVSVGRSRTIEEDN